MRIRSEYVVYEEIRVKRGGRRERERGGKGKKNEAEM